VVFKRTTLNFVRTAPWPSRLGMDTCIYSELQSRDRQGERSTDKLRLRDFHGQTVLIPEKLRLMFLSGPSSQ